jgi:hypothetical protein
MNNQIIRKRIDKLEEKSRANKDMISHIYISGELFWTNPEYRGVSHKDIKSVTDSQIIQIPSPERTDGNMQTINRGKSWQQLQNQTGRH